jgi:hypothetical protein
MNFADTATDVRLTARQAAALADSLQHGHIWPTAPCVSGSKHYSPRLLNKLAQLGLIEWQRGGPGYLGGYALTATGRAAVLAVRDTEAPASRQHYIDTGSYLTYGDRPEFGGMI